MEAKRYGVLFYPIVNKVEKTGTVEIMAKAKDAKQINRIFERMGYPAPVKEDAATKRERPRSVREQLQGARDWCERLRNRLRRKLMPAPLSAAA